MTKGKKKGAPAPSSHGYVSEHERHTERITLRLDPDTMARLRAFAFEHGWSVAECVGEAFKALERELKRDFEHDAQVGAPLRSVVKP